jgi:hypothetical protein
LIQRHRLAFERGPGVILGWHATFEDRKLDSEGSIIQHASTMRPLGWLALGVAVSFAELCRGRGTLI